MGVGIAKQIGKMIAYPLMICISILFLPGIYAMLCIADHLTKEGVLVMLICNVLYFSVLFSVRVWVGVLGVLVWPYLIFEVYANFFFGG
jgi:hypothetical protein